MPVDLSEFRDLNGKTGFTGRCSVAEFLQGLGKEDRDAVMAAFADPSIQASAIHKWMERRGYQRRSETVRTHRKGACACA